ncbi:hypothetical protein SEA_DOGGS_27 [Gordonia phage Doggs]|nr:hypothetical protein SEA_DOGGS_27 [Gordonia phage Doggs]
MSHPAPTWSGPKYTPAANVASPDGGPQGMSDLANNWDKPTFEAWLAQQWQETFGKTGIAVGGLRELVHAIISAFQGDIEPLEELIEESIRGIPLVGDLFADFWDAIRGEYEGDVGPLLAIQALFAPIRKVLEIFTGHSGGVGASTTEVESFWGDWKSYVSGDPVAGLGSWFAGAVDLGEIQEAIANLEEVAPTSPVTPAYVADINDMATCSRDDLFTYVINGSGSHNHGAGTLDANTSTGNITGSTSNANIGSLSLDLVPAKYKPPVVLLSSASPVDYTPIIVDRAGPVDQFRWRVGNDTSLFGVDAYFVGLCIYNPANGNLEKIWDSGDIKDGVANTTSLTEVALAMGIGQQVTPGQILFASHLQIAPGAFQGARSWACKPQPGNTARPGQLLNAWYYRTPGNHSSIPSSVSFASLQRRNDCIPWAAISVNTGGGA